MIRLRSRRRVVAALLGVLASACARVAPLSSLPAPPVAAGRATLIGRVRGKAFVPSYYSMFVRLSARGGTWRDSTMTDAHGVFAFRDLEPGDYVVEVQSIGFLRERRATPLAAERVQRLDVMLRVSTTVHGDCIAPSGDAMGEEYCR